MGGANLKWEFKIDINVFIRCKQLQLLHLFDFRDVADESGVVHKVIQLPELTEILYVILPDHLEDDQQNAQVSFDHMMT